MTTKPLNPARPRGRDYILPSLAALACAGAAYAGADTTFDPALQKFTDFLEGSGGKIITVMSLAGWSGKPPARPSIMKLLWK